MPTNSARDDLLIVSTECMKSQQCAPLKHHYDECAERVQQQQEENGKADEDCVEECKLRILEEPLEALAAFVSRTPPSKCLILTMYSLPPHALRLRLRRSQALQAAQVKHQLRPCPLPATITIPLASEQVMNRIDNRPAPKLGASFISARSDLTRLPLRLYSSLDTMYYVLNPIELERKCLHLA